MLPTARNRRSDIAAGFSIDTIAAVFSPAALAVTNAARVIFLIRIGKKGWESRVRQGR